MPFLAGIGAALAALTVGEIIVIAAVVAVGLTVVTSQNMTGIVAPPTPGVTTSNPLQLTLSNDAPRRAVYGKCRVSGVIDYWNVSGEGHEYLTLVVMIAAHRIQEVTAIYFDGKEADTFASGYYEWNYYDGTQTTADPGLMADFDEWNGNCILYGIAYAVVKLKYDRTIWQNGRPNVQFDVLGKNDIYDPRDGLTKWTNNGALVIGDYMTWSEGLGADPDEEMWWDTFAAAADVSAQLPEGMAADMCDGRYTVDGVVELTSQHSTVITQMLSACAGTIVQTEGKFKLFVGAARLPVDRPITDEDLSDDFGLQPMMPADQTFNGVKGLYMSATENWIYTDFPPVLSAAYVALDGGLPVYKDIQLAFTTSPMTAQRLATIFLRRARLEKSITLKCKWTCFNYEVWDVVPLFLPQLGWEGKLFQITDWRMMPPSYDDPGGIELALIEYDDLVYSDAMDLKPITPPGQIIVPDITVAAPLGALFATSNVTTENADGQPMIRFDWSPSTDIYAVGYEIAVGRYPFAPLESDYVALPGKATYTYTAGPFAPGNSYQGFIRVVNSFDRRSPTTASNIVTTMAGLYFPEDVENLTATNPNGQSVDLAWSAPDVVPSEVEVRWSAEDSLAEAVVVSRFAGSSANSVRLPRQNSDGFFFVAFISGGGLYGSFSSVAATARVLTGTLLQTVGFSRFEGDLENAIWVSDTRAVPKSQTLASEQGWETFDVMVPNPETEIRYFRKNATYVAGGELRVAGNVGWARAPGLPGSLPVVGAVAEVAYFGSTVYKTGTFELAEDANVKTGFVVNHSEPQGVVLSGFNGTLEQL